MATQDPPVSIVLWAEGQVGGGEGKRHQGALPSGTQWGHLRLAKVLGVQAGERDEDEQLCATSGSGWSCPNPPGLGGLQ